MSSTIIPIVKEIISKGEILKLKPCIHTEKKDWQPLIKTFCECVKKIYNVSFEEGSGGITLVCDGDMQAEAYLVDVDEEIKIVASDYHGCAYALATVLQLLNEKLEVEKVKIVDKPDKDYRGLMVDLARKWHPFATLKHYVDLCFFYKIKYLHFHFMDDEIYTLPSKAFPKLSVEGRSYTAEEIGILCDYAKERGVVLIPEIEMPGHAKTLISAYPEAFANVFDEDKTTICVGSKDVFGHMTKLIDEVMELFQDSPYIHLGGDEVCEEAWKACPTCQQYMKDHSMENTGELYSEFIGKVTDYVLAKGKRPIVWEGFPKKHSDRISKDVIVIAWESLYHLPHELVEEGFEIINASWRPLYIVPTHALGMPMMEGHDVQWDELDIMGWNTYKWGNWLKESASTLNPIHLMPTNRVIGGQLCAWEMSYECEISSVVVRLAALAERTWSVSRCCDDKEFTEKLEIQTAKAFRLIAEV